MTIPSEVALTFSSKRAFVELLPYITIGPLLVVFTHASSERGAFAVGSPGPEIDWRTEPPVRLTAGSLSLWSAVGAPWVNAPPYAPRRPFPDESAATNPEVSSSR